MERNAISLYTVSDRVPSVARRTVLEKGERKKKLDTWAARKNIKIAQASGFLKSVKKRNILEISIFRLIYLLHKITNYSVLP